jgi:hypothetical protein
MRLYATEKDVIETGRTGICLACAVLIAMILALDLNIPLGIAVVILYNAVVLVALRSHDKRFILTICIIVSILTVAGWIYKAPIAFMPTADLWKAVSNRTLALFTIWVEAYLGLQRLTIQAKRETALSEREKALEEVRVLRGFLPICASCKKIRDLGGTWTLLEKYITEHSEALFSHGLCPECTRKLFPQFFDAAKDREKPAKP